MFAVPGQNKYMHYAGKTGIVHIKIIYFAVAPHAGA